MQSCWEPCEAEEGDKPWPAERRRALRQWVELGDAARQLQLQAKWLEGAGLHKGSAASYLLSGHRKFSPSSLDRACNAADVQLCRAVNKVGRELERSRSILLQKASLHAAEAGWHDDKWDWPLKRNGVQIGLTTIFMGQCYTQARSPFPQHSGHAWPYPPRSPLSTHLLPYPPSHLPILMALST
jgi:hypothetical protein